ncbi:MAG: MFS transporter, partial [Cyanobacteria bacterium J06576_12]
GFTPDAATQPEGAVTGLRLFYTFFPIAGTLIAIAVMWNYDLSEEKATEIKEALEARKQQEANAS